MVHRGWPRAGWTVAVWIMLGVGGAAFAQSEPETPPTPQPSVTATAAPGPGAEASPEPEASPAESPSPQASPTPTASPTQPPIIVEPPAAGVVPGGKQDLQVMRVLGTIEITVEDPAIAGATIDQTTRTLTIFGKALGSTIVTVRDSRGLTREVPVRVADLAGSVAESALVRITGNPASNAFIKRQATLAAIRGARLRPNALPVTSTDTIAFAGALQADNVATVDVPLILSGADYFTVTGTTHVRVENFALPQIRPNSLLVSDYPERLKENGVLFTADLSTLEANRFLYYHYNPAGQPDRRIVLKVENPSSEPATLHVISGQAGPGGNEMEVGHLSTYRFLVHESQNEGTVISIAPNTTVNVIDQLLPAGSIVSNLLQLHELDGAPLHLALLAQDESDPAEGPIPATDLLKSEVRHARGVYPIPEFSFEYTYDADGPNLEIPIGQIPLPNLREGEALAGDYGVMQSITVRIVNNDPRNARDIALYANPRGGRATGTFIIDRAPVQAHSLAPFSHYKLRQYTVPPGGFIRTDIVTMPEGGSSYPLRLEFAPDDGSVAPGAPGSPIY
jgi:hypothetical protein